MLCQKRSAVFKSINRSLIAIIMAAISSWLQAVSLPTKEDCLREMDYWSDFIALIVASHQASGTAFVHNQFWPAIWPDDCLNTPPSQTFKLYFRPKTNGEQFSAELYGRLPASRNLVIRDYFFPSLIFYMHYRTTQMLRLYCYAFEKHDNIYYMANRLEFTLNSINNGMALPCSAGSILWFNQ